jgi:hypothetical protein
LGLIGAITTVTVMWSASPSQHTTIPSAIPSVETRLAILNASEEKTSSEGSSNGPTVPAFDTRNSANGNAAASTTRKSPAFSADDSVKTTNVQLAKEMQVIDRARTALQANNPRLCLRILGEHRRTFARPRLEPESAYLRMQAAQRMGDRTTAMTIAREIVRRYPNSPHVGRAEALLQRESEVPDSL